LNPLLTQPDAVIPIAALSKDCQINQQLPQEEFVMPVRISSKALMLFSLLALLCFGAASAAAQTVKDFVSVDAARYSPVVAESASALITGWPDCWSSRRIRSITSFRHRPKLTARQLSW
jgi:hypothetical protein